MRLQRRRLEHFQRLTVDLPARQAGDRRPRLFGDGVVDEASSVVQVVAARRSMKSRTRWS